MARSPRTWLLRVAMTVAVGALLAWFLNIGATPGAVGDGPRQMRAQFQSLVLVVQVTTAILAVILVAGAVQEERDDDTLDLLALTPVPPWRILASKVMTRLLLVVLLAGASLPLLSAATSIGGVAPEEVAGAALATVIIAVVYASLGAAIAVRSAGVIGPAGSALLITIPALVVGPRVYAEYREGGWRRFGEMCPFYWEGWGWPSLYLPLFWLPVAAGLFVLAELSFRERTGRSAPGAEDRLARLSSAATIVFLLVAGPLLAIRSTSGTELLPKWLVSTLAVPVFGIGLWGATVLSAQTLGRLAEIIPAMRFGSRSAGPRGRVFGFLNPVLHRELFTRAYGAAGFVGVAFGLLWGMLAFTLGMKMLQRYLHSGGMHRAGDQLLAIGAPPLFLGVLGAILLGALSAADEVRAGTLPLWFTTTQPPRRLVTGKLASVLLRTLPPAVFGAGVWWLGGVVFYDPMLALFPWGEQENEVLLPVVGVDQWWVAVAVARAGLGMLHAAVLAWAGAAWGLYTGFRLRGMAAWIAALAPLVAIFTLAAFTGGERSWVLLAFPWWTHDAEAPGVPSLIVVSIGLYAAFSAVTTMVVVRGVRRWTT